MTVHTLEQFARENFRFKTVDILYLIIDMIFVFYRDANANNSATISRRTNLKSAKTVSDSNLLWKYSSDPIRQPLLKSLADKEELAQEAVKIYINILKYMGDLPSRSLRSTSELTDNIFKVIGN